MAVQKFKKVATWVIGLWLFLTLVFLFWLDFEVSQYWGGHTQQVDSTKYQRPQTPIALVNVNVLSPDGNEMLPARTVLIEQGLIVKIAEQLDPPSEYEVIDASGQYLIPGLIDSHVHLWQSSNDLLLYLANGVTHIKELNGSEEHLHWKAAIEQGRPGPDMFVTSSRNNSSGKVTGWFKQWVAKMNTISDGSEVVGQMKAFKASGFDAAKIYTELEAEHFKAFNQASLETEYPILGHIPESLSLAEVFDSQLKELAHAEELVKALDREFGGYSRDNTAQFLAFVTKRSKVVAQQMKTNNMAVTSTLNLMEKLASQKHHLESTLQQVELEYVNPGIAESTFPSIRVMGWLPDVNIYRLPEDYPQARLSGNELYWNTYAQANSIVLKALQKQNVTVLAGTDANVPVMVPGFSLHDELASLVAIGFSEAEALRVASSNPADWMGIKTGRVAEGYQADLVLLRNNPLLDIAHTKTIQTVISNGRLYDQSMLDAMLAAVAKANQSSRKKDISAF